MTKKQEPVKKEIYMGYYRLVTDPDTYNYDKENDNRGDSDLYDPLPEHFLIILQEYGYLGNKNKQRKEKPEDLLQLRLKDLWLILTPQEKIVIPKQSRVSFISFLNDFFNWHITHLNKEIRFFTNDGKPIENVADVKRLWEEIATLYDMEKIKFFPITSDDVALLKTHLFSQHEKNLKEIEQAEAGNRELVFNSNTGKFSFNKKETKAVSKESRASVRDKAKKLMRYWQKGKPCPQSELAPEKPLKKDHMQDIYNDVSKIRKVLRPVGVNVPQAKNDSYYPPEEPRGFLIRD